MEKILNVTLEDIIKAKEQYEKYFMENQLLIIETHGTQQYKLNPVFYPLRFEAYSLILVQQGEMTIGVNYMTYNMKKNDIMDLFSHHLIESLTFSWDFKAYQIIISPDLYKEIIEQTNLPSIFDSFAGKYHFTQTIYANETDILINQIQRLKKSMERGNSQLIKILIKSELIILLTEFINLKLSYQPSEEYLRKYTRCEEIAFQFIQLLVNHCKTEYEVSFYSDKLCITSEYLSRIMKSISGKSVNIWIQQARVTEAKILLRKPYSTVRQVAEGLCFSDQSAFGKFFKKHTGVSPLEYQKKLNITFRIQQPGSA